MCLQNALGIEDMKLMFAMTRFSHRGNVRNSLMDNLSSISRVLLYSPEVTNSLFAIANHVTVTDVFLAAHKFNSRRPYTSDYTTFLTSHVTVTDRLFWLLQRCEDKFRTRANSVLLSQQKVW